MSDKTEKCCPEKVDALITNEETPWTDDDREWLESLNEVQVDKISVVNERVIEVEKPEVDHTLDTYLEAAPPQIQAVLNEGLKALDAKRQLLIDKISAHDGNSFSDEQLKEMETAMLENVAGLIPEEKKASYLGQSPPPPEKKEETKVEAYQPQTLSDVWKS